MTTDRREIKLTKGKVAIVDAEDYEYLNQWKWHAHNRGYASRRARVSEDSKSGFIMMHRLINSTPDGMETDHINRDRLDNRKHNLRSVSKSKNIQNMKTRSGSSIFRGVTKSPYNTWMARIIVNGKLHYLGYHPSEREAATVYDDAAKKYFGEHAGLNFPVLIGGET